MVRLVVLFCAAGFLLGCSTPNSSPTNQNLEPSDLSGEELAVLHCGGCHIFPEPSLLDKQTWENSVLPAMATRLGLGDWVNQFMGRSEEEIKHILATGLYPERPMLAQEDWEKIKAYYLDQAPDQPLPQSEHIRADSNLSQFEPVILPVTLSMPPQVTAIKVHPTAKELYIAKRNNSLLILDHTWREKKLVPIAGPISDMSWQGDQWLGLKMGQMEPNDRFEGELWSYNSLFVKDTQPLASKLQRPVDMVWGDLNRDDIPDAVICSFGFETGHLSWRDGKSGKLQLIKPQAGARNVALADVNGDSLLDIVAMFTQGKESIVAFINQGRGQFEEKIWLEFPPVYGSSHFQFVDVTQDGLPDIVYTNGDNGDYSNSLKPYHGVHLFENQGTKGFKKIFFYPLYGATKTLVADFDKNGLPDFAVSAFYAPITQPESPGFVLLSQTKPNQWKPETFPMAKWGNWMVMDVGDLDRDGDLDIFLGSFQRGRQSIRPIPSKIKSLPEVIWLKNRYSQANK